MLQRGLFGAAAVVMACAIGAALVQLAILILGLDSPIAITLVTLTGLVLLNSLRRRLHVGPRHRFAAKNPHGLHR
jgi:hypothetical protein